MKTTILARIAVSSLALAASLAGADPYTIAKPPDQGPEWFPISNDGGTYVYANSFVAPANGAPTRLGSWLLEFEPDVPNIRFEIWGDDGGPDAGAVFASTGSLPVRQVISADLNCFGAPVATIIEPLVENETYWFVATVVGEDPAPGAYQVGGHTQNSVYSDDGTFWFSNDPAGVNFDGQSLTPEMAFVVHTDGAEQDGQICGDIEPTSVPALDRAGLLLLVLVTALAGVLGVRARMA